MGVFDKLLGKGGANHTPTLKEALDEYDLVDVVDNQTYGRVVLATPKVKRTATAEDLRELGTSGSGNYTYWMHREYNNQLRGVAGLRKYNEMRRSDPTVRSTLRLLKTPVLNARWFIKPASDSTRDKNIADFVWWNLTE